MNIMRTTWVSRENELVNDDGLVEKYSKTDELQEDFSKLKSLTSVKHCTSSKVCIPQITAADCVAFSLRDAPDGCCDCISARSSRRGGIH